MPQSTVYDSTNVNNYPAGTTRALAYTDGNWPDVASVQARFPTAIVYSLTTQATGDPNADGYDCERGNGDALQSVAWAGRKLGRLERPGIYCSRVGSPGYGWPDVKQALDNAHIPQTSVDFLIADATNQPHLVPGSALTQWGQGSGGKYDISLTNGVFMAIAPTPPKTELNAPACVILNTPSDQGYYIIAQDGGVFTYGDAKFFGSAAGSKLAAPIISACLTIVSNQVAGYRLLGADGGVFAFGATKYLGSPNNPQ